MGLVERFLKSTYVDKFTTFSASELTKPSYQLWMSSHYKDKIDRGTTVGFKSAIGSAWHKMCEEIHEIATIKELSIVKDLGGGVTVGGTADELRWTDGKWTLGDHKTKGAFQAKKFLGLGKDAKPENDKEIMQLSIYRWLFSDMFPNIHDRAVVYLWVMGHSAREPMPEFKEVWLDLLPINITETFVRGKIATATADKAPKCDCDKSWACNYCEYSSICKESTVKGHKEEFSNEG